VTATEVLKWLESHGSRRTLAGMARYAIPSTRAFGIPVGTMRAFAKRVGRDHALAQDLWASGWYEARMVAAFIDDPRHVTLRQMNAWAKDFDSWAICDTVCFHLFDRSPLAWGRVKPWASARPEFVKRAGFALLASLVVHDKAAPDEAFVRHLSLVERGAQDERNFVKKAVNWALRCIGKRSRGLNAAAVDVARRLAETEDAAPRWVGKDALRELTSPAVRKRLAGRAR
jgi:3-methyladenine DNA glycosylase AlkD